METKELKHTKGKWFTDKPTFTEITVCTEKMDICTVLCIDIDDEEAEANAKLIASAPDLLDASESVLESLKQMVYDDMIGGMIMVLESAIKRAT